jgi:hypothetical protein
MSITVNWTSVTYAIGILGILIGTTAAVVWNVRGDRIDQLNHELEVVKGAKDWKLPETLNSLNELSEKVRLDIEARKKLETLGAENDILSKKNEALNLEIAKLNENNRELEVSVKKSLINNQVFEIDKGGAAELIKNSVFVGLKDVYSSWVTININNESSRLEVGNNKEISYANQKCFLTLKSIKYISAVEKAGFSFGCVDK